MVFLEIILRENLYFIHYLVYFITCNSERIWYNDTYDSILNIVPKRRWRLIKSFFEKS